MNPDDLLAHDVDDGVYISSSFIFFLVVLHLSGLKNMFILIDGNLASDDEDTEEETPTTPGLAVGSDMPEGASDPVTLPVNLTGES